MFYFYKFNDSNTYFESYKNTDIATNKLSNNWCYYTHIVNENFAYFPISNEASIFLYPNATNLSQFLDELIIPNDDLTYACVNGEIKYFSLDITNQKYTYSDLENPIKLYDVSDNYVFKWINNTTIALWKNNIAYIYKIDLENGTKTLLYTGSMSFSLILSSTIESQFTNNAFILNENSLGFSNFIQENSGELQLTKMIRDNKDYFYIPTITGVSSTDIRRGIQVYTSDGKINRYYA